MREWLSVEESDSIKLTTATNSMHNKLTTEEQNFTYANNENKT